MVLAGCGQDPVQQDPRTHIGVPGELQEYVQEFEAHLGRSIGDVPLGFADLDEDKAGICTTYPSGHKEVEIDQKYWQEISYNQRFNLIFHELGHCVLNLDHNMVLLDDNCPSSFMFDTIIGDNCLDLHLDEYIGEMF